MQLDSLDPALAKFNYHVNEVDGQRGEDGKNIDAYVNKGRVSAKLIRYNEAIGCIKNR